MSFRNPHPLIGKTAAIQIWESRRRLQLRSYPATLMHLRQGFYVSAIVLDESLGKERIFILRRLQSEYENYQFEFHPSHDRTRFPPIPVWPWEDLAYSRSSIGEHMPNLIWLPFKEEWRHLPDYEQLARHRAARLKKESTHA